MKKIKGEVVMIGDQIRQWVSGAKRDKDDKKESYLESISWLTLRRYAFYMKECAIKYGTENWIKGIPTESYEDSLMRHLSKYIIKKKYNIDIEPNTDHLSAALFNLQGLIHEEEIKKLKV